MGVWLFNALFCYLPATLLIALAYRMSITNSGGFYSAFIVVNIASVLASVLFMRLIVGETPTTRGWIAIVLILLASVFAANSGRNV